MSRPGIAIVHDYLTQRGGAERVALSMLRAFPGAPLYTALYVPDATFPEFASHDVRPLWPNRFAPLRRDHRRGLLLYPFAFSGAKVDADVVLCSSSGFAHGVRSTGRKIVYCYTPARWLYDQADRYLAGWPRGVGQIVRALSPALRLWDRRAAMTADTYLTSSTAVRERILRTYGLVAEILAPPVSSPVHGPRRAISGVTPGFALCVSRLLSYKNVGAVVAAFSDLPDCRLVVVGEGPDRATLERVAGLNVTLAGRVDDAQLAWLYANCGGVVCASYEDFGLTALEAASCGKPVAALRAGGFLDTVVDGVTGNFFEIPDPQSIASVVRKFTESSWDTASIERHGARFSESAFHQRLQAIVAAAEQGGPVEAASAS